MSHCQRVSCFCISFKYKNYRSKRGPGYVRTCRDTHEQCIVYPIFLRYPRICDIWTYQTKPNGGVLKWRYPEKSSMFHFRCFFHEKNNDLIMFDLKRLICSWNIHTGWLDTKKWYRPSVCVPAIGKSVYTSIFAYLTGIEINPA